jgi:hypothetical protein
MSKPTSKRLSRRKVLRGIGVSLALPLLDAMTPAFAASSTKPICRMLVNYVPNGIVMRDWLPASPGKDLADLTMPRILQPMEPWRGRMLVIEGLAQHFGWSNGDGTAITRARLPLIRPAFTFSRPAGRT